MAALTPRERLLDCLAGIAVPPPTVVPGGMMTMATEDAMVGSGFGWPQAHKDARAMAGLILETQRRSGLECLAAPFCMTVEAEALGCEIDFGNNRVLPHVSTSAIRAAGEIDRIPKFDLNAGRIPVVLEAIRILRRESAGLPVLGAVTGPVSLAAMVMPPTAFLKLVRREPETCLRLVEAVAPACEQFALALADAGCDVVMIAEPTATGEILGQKHFERIAFSPLDRLLGILRERRIPSILHICGDLRGLFDPLRRLLGQGGALSVDSMISGGRLREELPAVIRVGNVDATLLAAGWNAATEAAVRRACRDFHVVSPACGLAPTTASDTLRRMVEITSRETTQ